MNMAQGIAIYLTIYSQVNGKDAVVPFPGKEHGYYATHSDTFQDILAKMEIYAAVNIEKCGNGGVFHAADGKSVTWAQVWPRLAEHFGLVGTRPEQDMVPMEDFVQSNRSAWEELVVEHGLKENVLGEQNWKHVHLMLVQFDFDRQYDLSRSRAVGFEEEIDTAEGYFESFKRMRAAKILPPAPA